MSTATPAVNHGKMIVLTALSLSIGWGIRGNFGHEYGAMIAGALAAMAVVITSGREDWWRRVHYFALFGALGWSFGGSISYMQVVAYTHSGHSLSVLYGFASLFVIGFCWAAPGGGGTALAACLDRDRLTEFFAPMTAVFVAWWLQGVAIVPGILRAFSLKPEALEWYDSDWIAAILAIIAVLVLALIRQRYDRASSLIVHMAAGWWVGFLVLVVLLGLRMTPPRGDNWAGCVGLCAGILVYCARHGLGDVALATLTTGILGGMAFAAAPMLKLIEVTCGLESNWHSIMEQSTGLLHGLALTAAMIPLAKRMPRVSEDPPMRRWTEVYAVAFVLVMITYLNLSKNPSDWIKHKTMPPEMYGITAQTWFTIGYGLIAVAVIVPLARHLSQPLIVLPTNWLGRGQGLYIVFLWWMVVGNLERALAGFAAQRLVTEGVIHVNAVICTLLVLLAYQSPTRLLPVASVFPVRVAIRRTIIFGLIIAALSILADWAIVRAIYGDRFAGHASLHIRFGPNATIHKKK